MIDGNLELLMYSVANDVLPIPTGPTKHTIFYSIRILSIKIKLSYRPTKFEIG